MKNTVQKRKVLQNSFQHIYKISADGGVIFYRTIDHLVYYTIESVMSRRYKIPVLVDCHMFNHTHKLSAPRDTQQFVACESNINSVFTREYNKECGRKGRLFRGPFGSAVKWSEKEKKSALLYVLNNPVEKKLCHSAVEDRWTFLAYYMKEFPFSEKPVMSQCRWALRDAIKLVKHEFECGRFLRYTFLYQLFAKLNPLEREQLTDYIIQLYFYFDRDACLNLFGSWEKLMDATDNSTGKEFDVGEVFEPLSDIPYREMISLVNRSKMLGPGLPLLHLPESKKQALTDYFRQRTNATDIQIRRFIHWDIG